MYLDEIIDKDELKAILDWSENSFTQEEFAKAATLILRNADLLAITESIRQNVISCIQEEKIKYLLEAHVNKIEQQFSIILNQIKEALEEASYQIQGDAYGIKQLLNDLANSLEENSILTTVSIIKGNLKLLDQHTLLYSKADLISCKNENFEKGYTIGYNKGLQIKKSAIEDIGDRFSNIDFD